MKLKYYLRGLGIGIIVTAVVMGVSGRSASSESEKLPEARSESVLADLEKESSQEEQTEAVTTEAETVAEETVESTVTEPETGSTAEAETTQEAAEPEGPVNSSEFTEPEAGAANEEAGSGDREYIEITINRGDGSDTVSRKLLQAGLIESAESYDRYLCQNGYDKKLTTGTHRIPKEAKNEEIAKLLCSKN